MFAVSPEFVPVVGDGEVPPCSKLIDHGNEPLKENLNVVLVLFGGVVSSAVKEDMEQEEGDGGGLILILLVSLQDDVSMVTECCP